MWVHVLFTFASAGCGDGNLAVFDQKTQAIILIAQHQDIILGLSQILIRIAGARNG